MSAMHTSVISTEALGSRAARLAAEFIDGILVGVVAAILGLAIHSLSAYYVIAVIGSLLYAVLLLGRTGEHNGQTLGKQWLSLRVVSTSGEPVTFGIACKRELLGRFLPNLVTFGLYGLVDSLWILWDARKQTLHDKIGGTYVFKAVADPAQAPQLTVPGPPVFAGASATPPPPPPPPPPPGD
ncbi:MAG: RDD family protein [Actinobacteria bacterium]|nr:RDD family protein [Actinomycetota bacterium]